MCWSSSAPAINGSKGRRDLGGGAPRTVGFCPGGKRGSCRPCRFVQGPLVRPSEGKSHISPTADCLSAAAPDEKSQIQALDRTQPILPLRPGLPERQTHDYERHGTTTLFAALDVAVGKVIGQCQPRHRHQEFLRFLGKIDAATPANTPIHLILDNYGTHKHQTSRSEIMVRKASPVPRGLHPDQCLLAESRYRPVTTVSL